MPNVLTSLFGSAPPSSQAPGLSLPGIDINSLFSKLVSSGIIKKDPETKLAPKAPAPAPSHAAKTSNQGPRGANKQNKPAEKKEAVKPPEFNILKKVSKLV